MNLESGIDTNLTTLSQQSPFGGMPQMIDDGAIIEAESYDVGGQGTSYYDIDSSNLGNQYRLDEGVDMEETTDVGGGYNVGWIEYGEWLEYTTKVTEGTYNINFRVASEISDPGSFQVKLNDQLLGTVHATGTGGWQNWQTVTLNDVQLTGGEEQVLRLEMQDGGFFNLNWFEFESVNSFSNDDYSTQFESVDPFPNDDNSTPANNSSGSPQEIAANDANFNYEGRVDYQDPQAPVFSYPGTKVEFDFTGTSLKVKLTEDDWGEENYVDVYIDNNPNPTTINLQSSAEPIVYDIAQGLEDNVHSAFLVKRNDYVTGEFEFNGVVLDGNSNLLPSNSASTRQIEVYGDSISAAHAVEYEFAGVQDPTGSSNNDISNAQKSYASILAEDYDAELSLVAQSGISLVDGYGYWNNGIGMEAVYDKLKPLDEGATWNFNNYQPDLVIVALGQNDSSTINIGSDLSSWEWKNHYKEFMGNLRGQYPDAHFIGMFPNMYHNTEWDNYVTEAVEEYKYENNDNKVYSLIHEQVTPGHPRTSEQQAMADTLKDFIDGTLVPNGFQW